MCKDTILERIPMTGKSKPIATPFRSCAPAVRKRFAMGAVPIVVSLVGLLAAAGNVHATIDASIIVNTNQPAGGGLFNYTLTLNNLPDSTSQIETLWYSWIPGLDLMSSSPTSTSAPAGWTANIEHSSGGYYGDGYSVQYTTSTAPLNPVGSLQFGFSSFVTPAELAGNDSVYGYYPEETTYLYSGGPEVGVSESLLAQAVPEPSSLALAALGAVAAFGIACRKLRPWIRQH
jgi:hypothetical protein